MGGELATRTVNHLDVGSAVGEVNGGFSKARHLSVGNLTGLVVSISDVPVVDRLHLVCAVRLGRDGDGGNRHRDEPT